MKKPSSLIPLLIKHVTPGVQALVFMDRLISWSDYDGMLEYNRPVLKHISCEQFFKLGLIKFSYGFTPKETLANVDDSNKFRRYLRCTGTEPLSSEILTHIEQFTSPFGRLSELIEQIDNILKQHGIAVERKSSRSGFKFIPYLTLYNPANDLFEKQIAAWL